MAETVLNATIRKETGRKFAKAARNNDEVPGVFYLGNKENIPFQVKRLDLRPVVYTSETRIINLKLDDGTENRCVLKDVQFDPITDKIVHFDLLGLVAGEKIRVEVPISLVGTPIGVKEGGIVQHMIHRVEIEVLPKDLPEHIELNVEGLNIGDALTIGDLVVENLSFMLDPSVNVVSVTMPRIVEEDETAEGEEGEESAEPEVIGEETEEEES